MLGVVSNLFWCFNSIKCELLLSWYGSKFNYTFNQIQDITYFLKVFLVYIFIIENEIKILLVGIIQTNFILSMYIWTRNN